MVPSSWVVPVVNPFDENAIEAALQLREAHGGKVTVLTVGHNGSQEALKRALRMEADEAVMVDGTDLVEAVPQVTAYVLSKAIEKIGSYDLVILAEGSTDNYSGVVPSALAELLNLPEITYARELEVEGGKVKAVRNMEESFEVMQADLPALVTVAQEINEPRLPKFMAIRKAGAKPKHQWGPADIGLSEDEVGQNALAVETLSNLAPEQDRKNVILEGDLDEQIDGLVDALIKEGALGR